MANESRCGFDLPTFAMILSVLGVIFGIIMITVLILVLIFDDLIKQLPNYSETSYLKHHLVVNIICIVLIIVFCIYIGSSLLLFIGTKSRRASFLLPYLVMELLSTIASIELINQFGSFFSMIVITAIRLYLWVQIKLLYQSLKEAELPEL